MGTSNNCPPYGDKPLGGQVALSWGASRHQGPFGGIIRFIITIVFQKSSFWNRPYERNKHFGFSHILYILIPEPANHFLFLYFGGKYY